MKRRNFLSLAFVSIIPINKIKIEKKKFPNHIDSMKLYIPNLKDGYIVCRKEEYCGGCNWTYNNENMIIKNGYFNNCIFINCTVSGNIKKIVNCKFYNCKGKLDITNGVAIDCYLQGGPELYAKLL